MEPSMMSETADVAETAGFLRRFADLMSTGYNAAYLRRAADLLETPMTQAAAASEAAERAQYKYEAMSGHVEMLEAECDGLKHDIEGHMDVTSSILIERDGLRSTLQAREAELSELGEAHDRERAALEATLAARAEELEQLRAGFEREREDYAASLETRDTNIDELRIASERERTELQVQLKVRTDELSALRTVSEREQESLRAKVTSLEAKRVELRSAFDRIGSLGDQTGEHPLSGPGKSRFEAESNLFAATGRDLVIGESNAVVPKTTLRQARAQFEYLAKEFIPLGDIASQVMCELGAYTMDLALVASQPSDDSPLGDVALRILAPSNSASPVAADGM